MNPKTKILFAILLLTLVSLACATLTGTPEVPVQPPTNTPLPPLPTNTPLPPLPTNPPVQQPEPTQDSAAPAITGSGDILFEDDFTNPESGWDRYSDDEGFTDYDNGAYKIGVYTETMFYWANPYRNFEDVSVEVITTKISGGDDVQFGIVCRHQDVNNWYVLVVSADGFAAIRKRYQGSDLEYIAEWVDAPVVNQGNATNLLRAECIGTRLALYANGILLLEVNDADIPTGDVGLLAGTFAETEVEVLFDNFVVTSP